MLNQQASTRLSHPPPSDGSLASDMHPTDLGMVTSAALPLHARASGRRGRPWRAHRALLLRTSRVARAWQADPRHSAPVCGPARDAPRACAAPAPRRRRRGCCHARRRAHRGASGRARRTAAPRRCLRLGCRNRRAWSSGAPARAAGVPHARCCSRAARAVARLASSRSRWRQPHVLTRFGCLLAAQHAPRRHPH